MGVIKVKFGIFNPLVPRGSVEVEGVVDAGAMYSVIPRKILEELEVKPLERRKFRAFGGYIERDIGEVGIELMGRRTVTVIMGEEEDITVLGVTALEAFGLEVDPVKGTLREAELLLL
ncbi:aspartyl protease [Candidatus Bathyarchaeota archaeon]|nr:aspartyl protease [Candidatus Bathyarchaeota archaeon]